MISEKFLKITSLLGEKQPSEKILKFIESQGVFFTETPTGIKDEYYYEFFDAGLTLVFENDLIVQITVYFDKEENYKPCKSSLFKDIDNNQIFYSWLIQKFGKPLQSGGGDVSPLLGYTEKWLKYQLDQNYVNFQFSKKNTLSKVHFIYQNVNLL